jgi:hypothetical protein
MAAAPSANDLTRQQLDELDALLQRMLSLPLTPAETPSPPSLAQTPSSRLTAMPSVVESPRPPVFEPLPAPVMPAPEPTTPIIERKVVAPSVQIRSMPLPPASQPAAAVEPLAEEITHESVAFFLWPFVALNWLFDAIAGLFGPPGWLLRSGFGKNVLGLAGIALLLYTAAYAGTQQGWFTLPFPVPWPK